MNDLAVSSPVLANSADYVVRIPYDFGVGYINPATLPGAGMAGIAAEAIEALADELARYPARRGWEPLRAVVSTLREARGEDPLDPEEVVLTVGSLGAIQLAADGLLERGDQVIVEEWTYNMALTNFRTRGLEIVPLAMDDEGPIPAELERLLASRDEGRRTALYTIPTFHNPTGIVVPLGRREELIEIARRFDIAILEDDCYGDLRLEGEEVPSIYSLAPERTALIGSFSKILSPAIRLGYVVPPRGAVEEFLGHKLDGGTDMIGSAVAAEYLRGHRVEHLDEVRAGMLGKRDDFLAAIAASGTGIEPVRIPTGGLYIWARLPGEVPSGEFLAAARREGVAFFSSPMCRADGADGPHLRFAYTWPTAAEAETGLALLGDALKTFIS